MDMLDDRFRIEELAGSGGFGSVYRGYDVRMERPVAVKIVASVGTREAEMLAGLDHPGLPRLYDILRDEQHTYIVMEWIDGIDLEEYINLNGAMSETVATATGLELLTILDYLHTRKPAVIYQDLKPSNIMLMPDGHIKLVDFGTALAQKYDDEAGFPAGTIGYSAPEQRGLSGARHAGIRSDIYAWGAVMYSLLSGRLLNRPPYMMDNIRKACPQLSFGMCHVINCAVRREEDRRYPSAEAVTDAIHNGRMRDTAYRILFAMLFALCIIPFGIIWHRMYTCGDFKTVESAASLVWTNLRSGGIHAAAERFGISARLLGGNTSLMRDTGLMLVSVAWMIAGLRLMQVKKYVRVYRSVYLSDRRYPGLWVGALITGIIFGIGAGAGSEGTVSYAESIGTGAEEERMSAEPLPLSFLDRYGNRMLLDYDAPYTDTGEMRMLISGSVYSGGGYITVSYESEDGARVCERRIRVAAPPGSYASISK